ncbi:hypothetical protein, partial [Methylibium sp. T29]|uniref:hypothetical protein n=1 Tax=Methylibium sp. T29 TaxID=1430884 RepID=UPI0020A6D6C0
MALTTLRDLEDGGARVDELLRIGQFPGGLRMQREERLSSLHDVAEAGMDVDAGRRCVRGAGELGGSCQHAVVDGRDAPRRGRLDDPPVRCQRHVAQSTLGLADVGELGPRASIGEHLGRETQSLAFWRRAAEFQDVAGQAQRALLQVVRGIGLPAQHGQHVAGLQ